MAKIYMSEISVGMSLAHTVAKNMGKDINNLPVDNYGDCSVGSINVTGGSATIYVVNGSYNYTSASAIFNAFSFLAVCDDSVTKVEVGLKYIDTLHKTSGTEVKERNQTVTFSKVTFRSIANYIKQAGIVENTNDNAANNATWNAYLSKEFGSTNIYCVTTAGYAYTSSTGYLGGSGDYSSYDTEFYIMYDDRNSSYSGNRGAVTSGNGSMVVTKLEWFTTENPVDTYSYVYALLGAKGTKANSFTFDVYLDGKNEPNIAVQWNAENVDGSFSGQLTKAHMWFYPLGLLAHTTTEPNEKGVLIPTTDENVYHSDISKPFLDGEYRTSWSIACESVSNLGKIKKFAYLGNTSLSPSLIRLYLRIDAYSNNHGEDGFTVLHRVDIPVNLPEQPSDIFVTNVSTLTGQETAWLLEDWDVSVRVHFGEAEENTDPRNPHSENEDGGGKGKYDPDEPKPDPSKYDMGDGVATAGLLTTTYAMSIARLRALGSKLWSQSYYDVLKVQSNPIENIVSVKAFPFPLGGQDKSIVIGNIDMGVNGLQTTSTTKVFIGELNITEKYNSFLDYGSFTRLTIFLPYIGFKDLDTSQFMTTRLKVEYAIDFITGACKAIIYSDNIPIHEFDGTMGIDVPLTSSDRAQTDLKHLQSLVNTGASLANKNVLGAVNTALSGAQLEYNTATTSAGSPSCSSYSCRNIFIIYDRPLYYEAKSFNHTYGRVCNLTKKIGDLHGFTKTNSRIEIPNISATLQEKEKIKNILSTGFYA